MDSPNDNGAHVDAECHLCSGKQYRDYVDAPNKDAWIASYKKCRQPWMHTVRTVDRAPSPVASVASSGCSGSQMFICAMCDCSRSRRVRILRSRLTLLESKIDDCIANKHLLRQLALFAGAVINALE